RQANIPTPTRTTGPPSCSSATPTEAVNPTKTILQEPHHASDALDGHGGHLGTGSRSRCREASLRAAAAGRRPETSGRPGERDRRPLAGGQIHPGDGAGGETAHPPPARAGPGSLASRGCGTAAGDAAASGTVAGRATAPAGSGAGICGQGHGLLP